VKIYDRALSAADVAKSFNANKTDASPQLPKRVLPAGPWVARIPGLLLITWGIVLAVS